ncbi:hypothetical protein CHU98_g809 [Xylaria longipes]|nr:hypothetical protein CHU98_g809 [Xylaria longipes]
MPLDFQSPQASPEGGMAQGQSNYIDLVLRPTSENPSADDSHASTALAHTLGYGVLENQANETSDWDKLHLQPVLSHNFSARILMRPKIQGIHISSYQTNMDFGQWARLDGENSHYVIPNGKAILGVGIWALATDSEAFMEIEVLKRKTWRIAQTLSSKREAPADKDSSKRLRLSSAQEAAPARNTVLARNSPAVPGNNALVQLQRGEVIFVGVSKIYWLKRLDTIYEQQNSTVWRAESNKHNNWLNGEKIVVKVIKPDSFGGDVIRCAQAWKNECETHAVLSGHPAIVRLLGFDARFHSIYTEHIDAKSLSHHYRADSFFSGGPTDAQKIMHDIASALSHVHSKGKVHNDIKPANILYSPDRGAVLIDFGISSPCGQPMFGAGTPWYLSPEFMEDWQLRGPASDIWALGVVMLWALGHIPLPEATFQGWEISAINSQGSPSVSHLEAVYTMTDWLEYIKEARSKLRVENELEAIVKLTLETDRLNRIDAVSLNKRLDQLRLTAP